MKKVLFNLYLVLTACLVSVGCVEEAPVVNGAEFEIQSFDDFLWCKDAVDTIKFSLNADFKECDDVNKPITLALCDPNGDLVSTSLVTVYVDGMRSEDNTLEIFPENGMQTLQIGIVIDRSALSEDCTFFWYLKSLEGADGMKVKGINAAGKEESLYEDGIVHGTEIRVINDHVANTLKTWTTTIVTIVVAVVLAIILFVQCTATRFDKTQLVKIYLTANSPAKRAIFAPGVSGAVEIVLTSDGNKKQGFVAMLFRGKVSYIHVPGLPAEITLSVSRGRKGVKRIAHSYVGKVVPQFDASTNYMILTCQSETGATYKIEYPKTK